MLAWIARIRSVSFLQGRLAYFEQDSARKDSIIRDLQTEKTILEDRLRASLEDRQQLWGLVMESLREERASYHMQINAHWQKQGEAAPYPEAPHFGDGTRHESPDNPFINRPMMGSDMAAQATKRWINDYFKKADQ